MQSVRIISMVVFLIFYANILKAQDINFKKSNVDIIGRGEVKWDGDNIIVDDCLIATQKQCPARFEMNLQVKGIAGDENNVQVWLGFGFQDRDNRYSLGLRGGNNQDLYLCKYQSDAKNKMLALESLDFEVKPGVWYTLKIVFWEGHIRVYLNNEPRPRVVADDPDYLKEGKAVLGGGWLLTEYADFSVKQLSADDVIRLQSDSIKYTTALTLEQKEEKRSVQRQNYKAYKVGKINSARTEFSLDGNWLFMPGYQVETTQEPFAEDLDDSNWHLMNVPGFWNPAGNWLFLQDSHFPHLGSGISDNYRESEENRCRAYTFDFTKTDWAWYRHVVYMPKHFENKTWNLHFDAVSKVADIYVNGHLAGSHTGMFGEFDLDINKYLHIGKNVIAVKVVARKDKKAADADETVTQAVSVLITNDMLNSLPHGMFQGEEGGIWQSVKLVATNSVHISDVYANTRMDGANIEMEISNDNPTSEIIDSKIEIYDLQTGKIFCTILGNNQKIIEPGATKTLMFNTVVISPKTWSPENPNLYKLVASVYQDGKLLDETETSIGFRTVEKVGNQFYLNGNPYWLRGANQPPCGIAPNNTELANKFFKLMHDGNEMVTRSHGCPFTKAWMDAADKQGVGVSYEGSWPWLLISDIPSEELLNVWRDETIALVKKYRNHPSLLFWTINNEMYFTMFCHSDPQEIRLKKWEIVSDVIKEIRRLSPNSLISCDSGYSRVQEDYDSNLKPYGIDDGDVDDRHIYFNWYNQDFFQIYDGEWAKRIYWSPGANPDRLFFSQETSTGYTNNDDGHYNRKYLFNNYVPQSWVGDWAYEDKDPQFSLQRHAFMTKELYEVIRRTSPETAGVLLFSNVCWYKNVFDADRIIPYPIYDAFKKAASPILISAELFGRNFYAGTKISPRVCIVNNAIDGKDLSAATMAWSIIVDEKILSSGSQKTGEVKYYDRLWTECNIDLPENLPQPKSHCKLLLKLISGKNLIAENEYDLLIASKEWVNLGDSIQGKQILVYDVTGETTNLLDRLGIKYQVMKDLTEMRTREADLLIIANLDHEEEVPYNWENVRQVCRFGTNILLIHPGKHLQWLYYDKIESIYERKGRVVNMHIPEHGVFYGIDPMELAWWQQEGREKPRACQRSFRLKNLDETTELCTYLRPHTDLGENKQQYFHEMSGTPLLEIREGKGRIIASEMETNMGVKDPVAAKLLINMIHELLK